MKKPYFLLVIIILIFINGCSAKTDSNKSDNVYARRGSNQGIVNAISYNDGVYVGEGQLKSHGKEVATITISKGRITEVVFQRLDSSGKELISRTSNNIQIDRAQKALLEENTNININYLILDVIRKQSYDISIPMKDKDLLLNWKLAVKNALEKAKK